MDDIFRRWAIVPTLIILAYRITRHQKPWKNSIFACVEFFMINWTYWNLPWWGAIVLAGVETTLMHFAAIFLFTKKTTPYQNVLLGSIQQNNRRLYLLHTPESNQTFPLVGVSTCYLDEKCDLTLSVKEYQESKAPVSVEQRMWQDGQMILPDEIDGKQVTDLYNNTTWSILSATSETGVHTVQLPSGIRNIHERAFIRSEIKELVLPESLERIESMAFAFCYELKKVSLPGALKHLGSGAFSFCHNLEEVTFSEDSRLQCIGYGTFQGSGSLRSIKLPAQVEKIEGSAFFMCYNLEEVTFSEDSRLQYIGGGAFLGCKRLREIAFPARIEEIRYSAFSDCTNLEEITISNPDLKVEKSAFSGCGRLRTIHAPKKWKAAHRELLNSLPAYKTDENDPPPEKPF